MTSIVNEADTEYYRDKRLKEEEYTKDKEIIFNEEHLSPSGRFILQVGKIETKEGFWNYSVGEVIDLKNHEVIFNVYRNYPHFWHTFVNHPNGNEYLLCGEDYQGYSVLNLTEREEHVVLNEGASKGNGFCFTNVIPSPDGCTLAVEGCYWGCPYDMFFYNFSEPDKVPLVKIGSMPGDFSDSECYWEDNNKFIGKVSVDVRKSDGVLYNDLTKDEQRILDNDVDNLIACVTKKIEYIVRK